MRRTFSRGDGDMTSGDDIDQKLYSSIEEDRQRTQKASLDPIRQREKKRKLRSTEKAASSKRTSTVENDISDNLESMTEYIGNILRALIGDQSVSLDVKEIKEILKQEFEESLRSTNSLLQEVVNVLSQTCKEKKRYMSRISLLLSVKCSSYLTQSNFARPKIQEMTTNSFNLQAFICIREKWYFQVSQRNHWLRLLPTLHTVSRSG